MNDFSSENRNFEKIMTAFESIANNGVILTVGESSLSFSDSILKGMDAMSRLVVNLPQNSPQTDFEAGLESDLRVAVHRQIPEEFLTDINHHSFNLVVLCVEEISPTVVDRISSMVIDGGCVIVPNRGGIQMDEKQLEFADFHQVDLVSCMLFVKKPFQQERVRRGGRRAKLSGV